MTITFGGTGEISADTIAVRHSGIEMLPELGCANHEEADTRLIAHMVYNCRMLNHSSIDVHVNDRYNSFMHVQLPEEVPFTSAVNSNNPRVKATWKKS